MLTLTEKQLASAFSELAKCIERIGADNTIGMLRSQNNVTLSVLANLRKSIATAFGISEAILLQIRQDVRTDEIKYAKATYYHIIHCCMKVSLKKMEPMVGRGNNGIGIGLRNAKQLLNMPLAKASGKQKKYQHLMITCIEQYMQSTGS